MRAAFVPSRFAAAVLVAGSAALAACEATPERPQATGTTSPSAPVVPAATGSAQEQFGAARWPAALDGPSVIGSYPKCCLARPGARPIAGRRRQVMRLCRNRYWGHRSHSAYIRQLAERERSGGWPGLLG